VMRIAAKEASQGRCPTFACFEYALGSEHNHKLGGVCAIVGATNPTAAEKVVIKEKYGGLVPKEKSGDFKDDRNNLEKLTLVVLANPSTSVLFSHSLTRERATSPSD
ncbi:hypothetical protein Tco_1267098, partial [Tanacetum coccineum]